MAARDTALAIAFRHLGKPYIWGGNDPLGGFDCSGFVIEVLRSVGVLPPTGDWTAAMLLDRFKHFPSGVRPGALVFWGSPPVHVEMIYSNDPVLTIGASGGGSRTLSLEDAIKQDAYIKIRPMKSNPSFIVDPF